MPSDDPNTETVMLEEALVSQNVPKVYVNGFVIAQSLNDIALFAQTNGTPSMVVNMSFTSAKSLAIELTRVVDRFEKEMSHTILTMDDIRGRKTPASEED